MSGTDDSLSPRNPCKSQLAPESLAFNIILQEFSQGVKSIVDLQTGGELSAEHAYQQMKDLWQQLEHSREQLGIQETKPPKD